jgi:hypothetical protein
MSKLNSIMLHEDLTKSHEIWSEASQAQSYRKRTVFAIVANLEPPQLAICSKIAQGPLESSGNPWNILEGCRSL